MKTIKDRIVNQPKHNGKENCPKCYGKGYSTELSGTSWSSDFGEDVSGMEEMLNFKPCACVSKPSKQPADTKSVETSGDLVNCECCEESDYQKLSDALGTPCKPAYDLGFEAGRAAGVCEHCDKLTTATEVSNKEKRLKTMTRKAREESFEAGRKSAFEDMRQALGGLWSLEQKSQDEMKKQFNQE